MPIFDHNIRYRFEIENTGDARPDRFVDVTYSGGLGRQMNQTATIRLLMVGHSPRHDYFDARIPSTRSRNNDDRATGSPSSAATPTIRSF